MTEQQSISDRRRGWLVVAAVAGLVLLSGIYPLVAEPEDRLMGAVVVLTSASALAVALRPQWRGLSNAWTIMWLYPVALVLIAAFLLGETFQIVFYVLAVVAAFGLWLSSSSS
jgi:drug/metabolite transporter (DMT)-like permease